ncbi:23S rRNA accumulation protein YceD [Thaumasiovibrio subtropicus]|uniref:23S rRNA accumulation protein YceD n=1 Tax=Thaumasiovibrio subtropicus TaxID=1891207 RepID=UPI000B355D21|nr:23S rRNA accumulation protein YceD [Thaumasiovibrio subtropicus]
MQKVKLPLTVDPIRAAQKRSDYNGYIVSELLERLNESTQSVNSDVDVTVSFDVDSQKLIVVHGKASVTVTLECQRCNEPFNHHYEVEFHFSPIRNPEQADELPEAYEPIEIDENGEINLLELIEDELIVELPQVAMHDEADCKVSSDNLVFGEIPSADERPNPFAVLESLKHSNKE